ncbi:MAG: hypothetical protein AAFX93_19785 [Verrucomicrobiota bacterium]
MNNLRISSPQDALEIGRQIAASGMFGDNIRSAEAGAVIAWMAYGEGLSLAELHSRYHFLPNGPSMKTNVMAARFRELGGHYKIIERSDTCAAIEVSIKGECMGTFAFTMEDAVRAKICFKKDGKTLLHNWANHPKKMLWARVLSDTIDALMPEVKSGVNSEDEAEDNLQVNQSEPTSKPTPVEVDFSVCPIGNDEVRGKPWSTHPSNVLKMALKQPIAQEYKNVINEELHRREARKINKALCAVS